MPPKTLRDPWGQILPWRIFHAKLVPAVLRTSWPKFRARFTPKMSCDRFASARTCKRSRFLLRNRDLRR